MEIEEQKIHKGGTFLLDTQKPSDTFSPEDYTEEQMMLRSAVRDFINQEIEPNKAIFDSKAGTELAPKKIEIFGELGFLGLAVPKAFGGFGCDIKTDVAVSEVMSDSFSFSQTLGIQKGLGINTILFYGNPAQQEKYLNGILTGKLKCSYCLTEPSAGSDANAGKTRAILSEDGKHYILNGQKMWITNSGFADIFSVFCRVDDDPHLSCLIVEKEWGVTLGEEENKLGIHGSSTRQVFFENVKVPVENLLGTRNKGLRIALDALNMGRLAIGVAGSSIAKRAFRLGVSYANQRVQFGQPISAFGAIQEKIANMACEIYALESSWNRLAGDMDALSLSLKENGTTELEAKQKAANDFSIECAIIKVLGSEIEQYVVDEALQMHGGMGFSAESEISILYKNIRGNRIYEGTNEINRLVITGNLLKKGFKGEIPLMEKVMEAMSAIQEDTRELHPLPPEAYTFGQILTNVKKVSLLSIGIATQKHQMNIKDEQQILHRISNILSFTYFIESAILRSQKLLSKGISQQLTQLYIYEKIECIKKEIKEIIHNCYSNEEVDSIDITVQKLLYLPHTDIIDLRRKIAHYFIQTNEYKI